ncbi:MAG: hypothetical protein H6831_04945 [Planctomycetes bacterium]|nr:hypothetical protein [Planctomycetota bacterium]
MHEPRTPSARPGLLVGAAFVSVTIAFIVWLLSSSDQLPESLSSAPNSVDGAANRTADHQSSAVSSDRAAHAAHEPTVEPAATEAGLQFLSVATREPVADEPWLIHAANMGHEVPPVEARSDADGRIALPAGSWQVESLESTWLPLQSPIEIEGLQFKTVWVQRLSRRSFCFVSPSGAPLQGVSVQWFPWRPRREMSDGQLEARCLARSNDAGEALIEDCACENGMAVCLHPEYERVLLSLCGKPDGVIHVAMTPVSPPRALTFVMGPERTPVTNLVLSSPAGYVLASSAAGSSEVLVPSWVLSDEPILVESPATQPCLIRLGALIGEEVLLPARKRLSLRVRGDLRCAGEIRVALRQERSSDAVGVEALLPTHALVLADGDSREISVPAGTAIRVVATDACGNLVDEHVAPDVELVDLVLGGRTGEQLVVRVIDRAGRSVSKASANTRLGSRVEADDSGRLLIPITPDLDSFELHAKGFSTLTLVRSESGSSLEGTGELIVTLRPVVSNRVLVQDSNAEPLSGMRVIIWQPMDESAVPPGSAWIVPRVASSIAGTTGGDGQVVIRGLRVGEAKIEIRLPTELGTDAYERSLYGTPMTRVEVTKDAFHVMDAPNVVNLALEVHSSVTGRPVRGFELRSAQADGPRIEVSGGVWQGWVAQDVDPLQVIVEGLGIEQIRLGPEIAGRRQRVLVGAGPTAHVRLTGLPTDSIDSVVNVMIMRNESGGLELERSVSQQLDANGALEVVLGGTADPWIGISSLVIKGESFRFEPAFQAANAGATLEFSARKATR